MSIEKVRVAFAAQGIADRIRELDESSATVALAAQALGCEPGRIAKTLSFQGKEQPMLIVAAGDGKIDNHRFKERFGVKAKMLAAEEVPEKIGHAVGGVCPFAVNEGVEVYLDDSLRRFETVFPACGSSNSAIEMTLPELEHYSGALGCTVKSHTKKTTHRKSVMRGLFHMRQNQGISRRPQLSHSTISPLADVTRLSTADGSDILHPLHWLLISRASGGVMRFLIS